MTDMNVKRCIYFCGHPKQKNSAHVVQVCADCSTFPTRQLECSWRTVANLYNLQTVRGNLSDGVLDLDSSMSGPHHYYGNIDPTKHHTIKLTNGHPIFTPTLPISTTLIYKALPSRYIVACKNVNWIKGTDLTPEQVRTYKLVPEAVSLVDTSNKSSVDSLFAYPGILEMNQQELDIPLLTNPQDYSLVSFGIQVVRNDKPFAFNQSLVRLYQHAQHKLRVVTYNYGGRYVKDYLMHGNGVFLEQHEFIQSITPSNAQCGGYVLAGRWVDDQLELIRLCIPFGYTLLINVLAIHGDSGLVGYYIMSMTGNHYAMATANTVYLKYKFNKTNVEVVSKEYKYNSNLLLTSNQLSLRQLRQEDALLKKEIMANVMQDPALYVVQKCVWQPVILTPNNTMGWNKTIGVMLPNN